MVPNTHLCDMNWTQQLQVKGAVLLFCDVVDGDVWDTNDVESGNDLDLPVVVEAVGIALETAMLVNAPSFGRITTTNFIDCKSLTTKV